MATISNTPRPGYVWDSTDNVWYPIGVGAHGHTADSVGAISNALVDAKADLITATANDTPARLGVGSNDQVLTADSSTATGLKWATPATPTSGLNLIATASFSGSTSVSVNNCFSATYTNYLVIVETTSGSTTSTTLKMRVGGTDDSTGYYWAYYRLPFGVASPTFSQFGAAGAQTSATIQTFDTKSILLMNFARPFLVNRTSINWHMTSDKSSGQYAAGGVHQNNFTSYDGFTFTSDLAPTGNYYVYGYGN